jgi:hypothetical protein
MQYEPKGVVWGPVKKKSEPIWPMVVAAVVVILVIASCSGTGKNTAPMAKASSSIYH